MNFEEKINNLKNVIHNENNDINKNQDELHKIINSMTKEEMAKLLLQNQKDLKEKDEIIELLNNDTRRIPKNKNLELYNIINFHKYNKTEDGKLIQNNPELYSYNPYETSYDKNLKKNLNYYREYQKRFINDWSISNQELVILYYGVGSGKTLIAVNCAEQFNEITPNSYIYFIIPASLVLSTINECYNRGIDAGRKNEKGEYIYNFISYQQLLRSKFDFKENSLLIIDEAHNLRNIKSVEISEKESARKYKKTGDYSLVGNKLAEKLIQNSNKFLRSIFMTGTLFINSSEDIEALMSIGYKKRPFHYLDTYKYEQIINSDIEFKTYYEGLISYYKVPKKSSMPTKNFKFIPIIDKNLKYDIYVYNKNGEQMREPYFIESRNQAIEQKITWIIKFLKLNPNDKTLIYSQFLDRSMEPLIQQLKNNNFKFGFISGKLNNIEKLNIVKQYNEDKINILLFTLSIKEGISFKETNNIIIFQPYWNYAIMEQILARGIRLNSHKLQDKSIINLLFLIGINEENSYVKNWFEKVEKIMNNDIKDFIFDYTYDDKERKIKKIEEIGVNYGSRDINLINRMIIKQEEINVFEKRILNLDRFEDVNNNENNEFIKEYKKYLSDLEDKTGKTPSIKECQKIKKEMYKEYYEKNIKEVDKKFIRFDKDEKYKINRNPDLEQKSNSKIYENKNDEIRKLIKKNSTIEDFLNLFNITKQDITLFQANFTPENEIEIVINKSNIKNDKRENIKILEPTAGIGNFISSLIKLNNNSNFMIDCNEFYNPFYQIGKTIFENIDNIKWYNCDFWIYQNKYNYDYIIGNPPFNLAHQEIRKIKQDKDYKGEPQYEKKDIRLYDIHFVTKSYNMLNDNGILCMIISDRFLRDKSDIFNRFNENLKRLKEKNNSNVDIIKIENFKSEKNVSKKMETNFGMVCIKLLKNSNVIFSL